MTDQRYRVIADRDKGDEPRPQDIQDRDRYTLNAPYFGDSQVVRIERPAPTNAEPNMCGCGAPLTTCAAAFGQKVEPRSPHPPTRELAYEAAAAALDSDHLTRWERAAVDAVLARFPQPTPSAEPVDAAQAWDDGFEAGATWPQSTPSGVPVDPPINPYEADYASPAAPPSIADLAPGTIAAPYRSIVQLAEGSTFRGKQHGDPQERFWFLAAGMGVVSLDAIMAHANSIDPSTIRDVTPPPATPEVPRG